MPDRRSRGAPTAPSRAGLETGDGCEEPELVTGNGFPASRPFTIPGVVAVAHDDPWR